MGFESRPNIQKQRPKIVGWSDASLAEDRGYQSYADFRDSGLSFVRLRFL
jgi:hypothetical protein